MAAPLLIVAGPPGSGKTTVSARFAEAFGRSAHVLGEHFWRYIVGDWQDPTLPESDEQNALAVHISAKAAARYANAGYTTVLDGQYGPWYIDQVKSAAQKIDVSFVVLRADLQTCLARCESNPNYANEQAALERMYEHFNELGQFEKFVLDTTTTTPEEATNTLLQRFEAGELLI